MKSLQKLRTAVAAAAGESIADQRFETETFSFSKSGAARPPIAELTAEDINIQASETGALLEAILKTQSVPQGRGWGLNE